MKTSPRRFLRPLLNVVVILGSLAGLAWLVATQHEELGRALAGVGHAKLRLVVFAVLCERVSMFAFARMQVRLLRAGGQSLGLSWSDGASTSSSAPGEESEPPRRGRRRRYQWCVVA